MFDRLLTPFDLGQILAIPPRRVERLAKNGRLPRIEVDGEVRFTSEDVAEFLRGHRVDALPESDIRA